MRVQDVRSETEVIVCRKFSLVRGIVFLEDVQCVRG